MSTEPKHPRSQRTEILNRLHATTGAPDTLRVGKDGICTARWGYFYRHGRSVEGYAQGVRAAFPAGDIVSVQDRWAPWPRDSFFEVRFRPSKPEGIDTRPAVG